MKNVKVAGVGLTKFGELWDKTLFDLATDAAMEAINDSGLTINQIEATFVGNMIYGRLSGQDHLGAAIATQAGIKGAGFRVEGACASGGLAVHLAVQSLLSGTYKNVLVVGVEKMTDASISEVTSALMGAGSDAERKAGLTFPGLYALMAKAHMQKYGTTRKHLASVSVKNHYHASLNSKAQFPFEITEEKVLNSPCICSPLSLFDTSPITDGAAALVLTSDTGKPGVYITGSAVATDTVDLASRKSLTEIAGSKEASQKALKQAGIEVKDIKVAEVHDCFTIAEIMAMEDLGFCGEGEGGKYVHSGTTKLGGKLPVNTSGGLKACGHPVGATGVKQIVEITEQLRKTSGKRQVDGANVGLTQNVGGTGGTVVVHILQT
ncbi:MAG: acetyl-CoA acetyltransferase [Microgenomates group bacterium Gr01-1014_7]|nr:MAG: acetyl-CoA acetyltransferase [Microgenomates group bacterium Gr01-1014_7]